MVTTPQRTAGNSGAEMRDGQVGGWVNTNWCCLMHLTIGGLNRDLLMQTGLLRSRISCRLLSCDHMGVGDKPAMLVITSKDKARAFTHVYLAALDDPTPRSQ